MAPVRIGGRRGDVDVVHGHGTQSLYWQSGLVAGQGLRIDQYYDIEYPYDASTELNDALTSLDETASPSKELNDLDKLIQDKLDDIQQ